ncbi:hypothetical protein JCM10213v2_003659 [Rhodosporidiobolus nylandii]
MSLFFCSVEHQKLDAEIAFVKQIFDDLVPGLSLLPYPMYTSVSGYLLRRDFELVTAVDYDPDRILQAISGRGGPTLSAERQQLLLAAVRSAVFERAFHSQKVPLQLPDSFTLPLPIYAAADWFVWAYDKPEMFGLEEFPTLDSPAADLHLHKTVVAAALSHLDDLGTPLPPGAEEYALRAVGRGLRGVDAPRTATMVLARVTKDGKESWERLEKPK